MKRILLLLTILICTSTFAEQREKIKSATLYTKFYAQKIKDYSAYRGVSQDDLRKEFRNTNALYEININYFGSILCRSKILTFKKFIKELPESGKVGFVVTVDRKQEYQKVYFEVLDDIYDYLYVCRKKSNIADDKLDQELPYFVICIAKGKYDEKIISYIDTTKVVYEPELEESETEIEADSIIEVAIPKEVKKIKPKKVTKKETIAEPIVTPDNKTKEGEAEASIIFILAVIAMIMDVITNRYQKYTQWRAFFWIILALEIAISALSIYLLAKIMNGASVASFVDSFWGYVIAISAIIFVTFEQLLLLKHIIACISRRVAVFNLNFSICFLISLAVIFAMSLTTDMNLNQLNDSYTDSILLKQGFPYFISAIAELCAFICFFGQIVHFIVRLHKKPLYLIIMLVIYPLVALSIIINATISISIIVTILIIAEILKIIGSTKNVKEDED